MAPLTIPPACDILTKLQHGRSRPFPERLLQLMPRKSIPVEERFWRYAKKGSTCWLWTGATNDYGYGVIGVGRRSQGLVRAHHVSWKIYHGAWPKSAEIILHKCDNPPCVNPDHLFLGTLKDNSMDMMRKGRGKRQLTARFGKENVNGILSDADVRRLRAAAGCAPPRRHGRLEFWARLGKEFGIQPSYAQQLAARQYRENI